MISKILTFAKAHAKTIAFVGLAAGGVLYLAAAQWRLQQQLAKATEAQQKLQTEIAALRGFQAITPTSASKVEAALSPEAKADLAAIRKQVRDTSVAVHGLATVVSSMTTAGTLTPATETAPPYCTDIYHRFRVNTRDCTFEEKREQIIETIVARGVDGKTRLTKQTVRELDPVTHQPIPVDPPKITSKFEVTEETAPARPFTLKIIGGVDERLAPGLGLQFVEVSRISGRIAGFYNPDDGDLRGMLGAAWRPKVPFFDSQIAIGAGVGLSTKKSGLIVGGHLTVPLGTLTKD